MREIEYVCLNTIHASNNSCYNKNWLQFLQVITNKKLA
jgi:hypothetical protein